MKIDRRLRQYRTMVEKVCNKFNFRAPIRIEIMKNWVNRPEINWSKVVINPGTRDYIIKVRNQRNIDGHLIDRKPKNILKNICEELQHYNSHISLTNEVYDFIKEKN